MTEPREACSMCEGLGEWDEAIPCTNPRQDEPYYKQVICPDCEGTGYAD